jgi:hypothetical protein
MNVQKFTAIAVCAVLFSTNMHAGVGGNKAAYRGGSVTSLKEGREAKMIFEETVMRFEGLQIPYAGIESIEYGQNAGRRIGAAAALTVLAGPIGLLALASKKKKHMVTIGWKDAAGVGQAAVFECGKDVYRSALAVLEAKSGKPVEYQDKDAAKQVGGGK